MLNSIFLGIISLVINSNGAVDDYTSTAIVAAAQTRNQGIVEKQFEIPALILTNGNCEPFTALSATMKMVEHLHMNTRVGLSRSRVWTPLPWQWRWDSNRVNHLPLFQAHSPSVGNAFSIDGDTLLRETLKNSTGVKILTLGPLTSIADLLKKHPELHDKINELHWMGGAIDVPGNIFLSPEIPRELLNEKAEWNVFSDPESTDWIFKNTSFDIYLYPLDISQNTFPKEFLQVLKQKKTTPYTSFVTDCYKLVEDDESYRMWGILAVAGVVCPEILKKPAMEKLCVETGIYNTGALYRDVEGRDVWVYKEFHNNEMDFYENIADILSLGDKNLSTN